MKHQTLFSLLLTSAVVAEAYTITGRVADPQGEPHIGANALGSHQFIAAT